MDLEITPKILDRLIETAEGNIAKTKEGAPRIWFNRSDRVREMEQTTQALKEFGMVMRERDSYQTSADWLAKEVDRLRARVAELEADQRRVDWIEKAILSGVLSSCFELDGGIHVTLDRPGEISVAERERNTFRDAIDSFIVNCPEP